METRFPEMKKMDQTQDQMDPAGSWEVTIDSLIATIGTTSHRVTNFIRAVRAARGDLVHVTRELSDLRLELELLRDEHNVPPQIQSRGLAVLDSCGVVLRRIGSLLGGDASSSPSPSSPSPSSSPRPPRSDPARPPRWSVKERFATSNLCNCLQTYREALTILPDVACLRLSKDGAQSDPADLDTAEVEEKSNHILEAVDDLREAIPQAEPAISDSRPVLELYLNEVAAYTQAVCNYLIHDNFPEPPASNPKPPDHMAPAVNQGVARVSSKHARKSPPHDSRSAVGTPGTDTSSPLPNGPLEMVGPWFPSEDLPVPFYSNQNQEQVLQHRANSFHVPRSPAPHSPLPRPPPQSSPPLPPPKGALPMLPPGAPRPKTQRQHIAELAGNTAPELRHVAQHYTPQNHYPAPSERRGTGDSQHARKRSNASHKPTRSHPNADYAHEAAKRGQYAGELDIAQPPQSADAWNTSYYVPSTPPSTSGQSSQRTSFQPSSLDSAPSRDTYRSSVSTGPLSNVDSLSPNTSPRPQLPPTFESTSTMRPPSPRPSTTTTRSSGSAGKGGSLMDKIPGVFRAKRKSLQSSNDSAQTTFRNSVSTASSSTVDQAPVTQTASAIARRAERQIDIVPAEGLSDGKGPGIHHIEISPTGSTIATQHANNTIKVWSITTGAVEGFVKYSSKVQPGPRSRMYFLRPHAIMSENSTLVAITASYGNTIELWNWTKKKKIQSIDHAARWACYPGDVFEANMRPLAVYRSESDRIDLYTATRDAKKPFVESRRINLVQADLPFVPKFPDLAYSATGPLLVGAAGPRPGAPPEAQQTILLAWQIDEQQENPRPYRWVDPEHPELSGALPACLATYGSVAVSIWFPANYKHVVTARGENKKIPIPTPHRHVLVWDLATNRTRFFSIPNVLSCISPDCRYVAYCLPGSDTTGGSGKFVVLDVTTGAEIWSGPDELDIRQAGGAAASGQLLGDLEKVTEFRFTDDSGLLYVADQEGGVGIYEVRQAGAGRNGSVSTASGGVAGPYAMGDMGRALGLERSRTGERR